MPPLKDLIGKRFGRLVVIKRVENDKHNKVQWLCQCDCGNKKIIGSAQLLAGQTISCGCYHKEICVKNLKNKNNHKLSKTRLYRIYAGIKERCLNINLKAYKNYGGRGIKVCKEWKNDFMNFYNWAINNGYSDDLTIDRIDVNGNYEPNNCRWVTKKVQNRNTRANRNITYNGETHCVTEWAEILNINRTILNDRLNKLNWTIEKTLTTPKCQRSNTVRQKNSKSLEIDKTIKKY